MKTSIATVGSALALILAFSFVANDGVNAKDNSMKILERHQIEHECERTVLTFMRDFEDKHGKAADLFAKMEYLNPSGSIKDRVAASIIQSGEESGALTPGQTIIEASTGNTALALALIGKQKGYKVKVVMLPVGL